MSNVSRLIELLDEQLANYERLQTLLAQKRGAVEVNDLQALASTAQAIEQLIADNNALEGARQEVTLQLMHELGMAGPAPTLQHIIQELPEAHRRPLLARRERLRETLADVAREAQALDEILRMNLHFVDRMIRTMFSTVPNATTYERRGTARPADTLRLLDRTV